MLEIHAMRREDLFTAFSAFRRFQTPPVTYGDSPLKEGAFVRAEKFAFPTTRSPAGSCRTATEGPSNWRSAKNALSEALAFLRFDFFFGV